MTDWHEHARQFMVDILDAYKEEIGQSVFGPVYMDYRTVGWGFAPARVAKFGDDAVSAMRLLAAIFPAGEMGQSISFAEGLPGLFVGFMSVMECFAFDSKGGEIPDGPLADNPGAFAATVAHAALTINDQKVMMLALRENKPGSQAEIITGKGVQGPLADCVSHLYDLGLKSFKQMIERNKWRENPHPRPGMKSEKF